MKWNVGRWNSTTFWKVTQSKLRRVNYHGVRWQTYFLTNLFSEPTSMRSFHHEGRGRWEGFALWILFLIFYIYELLNFSRKTSIIRRQVLQTITTKLYPNFLLLDNWFPPDISQLLGNIRTLVPLSSKE